MAKSDPNMQNSPGLDIDTPLSPGLTIALPLLSRYMAGDGLDVLIPLWLPLVVFAVMSVALWRFGHGPRVLAGHCPCGYSLTGNQSACARSAGRESHACHHPHKMTIRLDELTI